MKIESVALENFRCYENQIIEFGDQNAIYGHNGAGKSTIAEAVVWCLFGTDILGKSKQDENLMRLDTTSMSVAVTFITKEGQGIVFARTRVGKKSSTLTVNGTKPKAGEVEGIFGTVSEFLSVFFPGYFSSLEPKEAKSILARCVPDVPKDDVLKDMNPTYAEILSHDKFAMGIDSVDVSASKVRAEIADMEKSILRYEGQLDAYRAILDRGQPVAFQSKISANVLAQYEDAKHQIKQLSTRVENRGTKLKGLIGERQRLADLYRTLRSSIPVADTHCHTCGQELPAEKAQQIRQQIAQKQKGIRQKLSEIEVEGTRVRAEIERVQSMPETVQMDSDLQRIVQEVDQQLRDEQQLKIAHEAKIQMYNQAKADMQVVQTDLESEKKFLAVQQQKLKALQEFRFKYVRLQHDKLNSLFRNVSIRLIDWNDETGEIRESFRIEWKGRPYRLLSFSEKIRCDLEIGRVLAQAKGESMPVYVDNAESVQNLFEETFSGQVIAAFVANGGITVQTNINARQDAQQVA